MRLTCFMGLGNGERDFPNGDARSLGGLPPAVAETLEAG